jgi:MerR family transcriptional regulator, light-induced transcriptional regulator
MASVFGMSALRSRLDSWWGTRKNPSQSELDGYVPETGRVVFLARPQDENRDLSALLENLVIPKLIVGSANAENDAGSRPCAMLGEANTGQTITAADIDHFCQLALGDNARAMLDFVEAKLGAGSSVESIFVELLAPAARRLGQFWEDDSGDFVDVTMGLWRIQEILRELTMRAPPFRSAGQGIRRALFSPMPGEQHSLGTLMVSECFERAGWDCEVLLEPAQSELIDKVAKCHFDIVGLTISCDCPSAAIGSLVRSIKAVSPNPHVRVMIGGRVVNEQPELVAECGADATAIDAPSAVAVADQLVPVQTDCFERLT